MTAADDDVTPDVTADVTNDGRDVEDTVVRASAQQPARPAVTDVEDTVIRLVEPGVRDTTTAPIAVTVHDVLAALPYAARRIDAPPTPASTPEAPAPVRRTAWSVRVVGTETVVPLDRPAIFGRRPGATRVPEIPEPRRVVLPAELRQISARHVRVEQLGDSLVVTDLESTNGVRVHWATGPVRRLRPGESCVVLPDAVVELGDGVELVFAADPPEAGDGDPPGADHRPAGE